jgi:hypothetical protein
MLQVAEIEEGLRKWTSIAAADALKLPRSTFFRCPKCGARVSVHRAAPDGNPDHFEHWPNSGGCTAG